MKISLEELKARSKNTVYYPQLVMIAREAKSPTAAFDLADRIKTNVGVYAKECRFLAMIKRDYGKKIFEQVVNDLTKEAHEEIERICLEPFIQTANRIVYLFQKQVGSKNNGYIFPDHDLDYADVVEGMLKHLEKIDHSQKQIMMNAIGGGNNDAATAYLKEAKGFVIDIRAGRAIDSYCLEKTARVLHAYVFTFGKESNILNRIGSTNDRVHHYSVSQKHKKEKNIN